MVALTGYFFWSLRNLLLDRHAEFTPEQPDLAWIIAGETAVLGLMAAIGSLGVRSWWRLAGVVFLAAAGGVFYVFQPPTVSTAPVPMEWQINVLRPLAIGTGWLLVAWLGARVAGYHDRAAVSPVAHIVRPASLFLMGGSRSPFSTLLNPNSGFGGRFGRSIKPPARSCGKAASLRRPVASGTPTRTRHRRQSPMASTWLPISAP